MKLKDRIYALNPDAITSIRRELGNEGAEKANAIISILRIGGQRSVAYSKAILAAVEMALELETCFPDRDVDQKP